MNWGPPCFGWQRWTPEVLTGNPIDFEEILTNTQDSNQGPRQQKSPEKLADITLTVHQIRCQKKEN